MALFDQLVGSLLGKSGTETAQGGGRLAPLLDELLSNEKSGGLSGLVEKFKSAGMGDVVASWIGTGQNQPIDAGALQRVLGSEQVQNLAAKTGLPVDQLLGQLAEHLPGIVDRLTPGGQIPEGSMLERGLAMLKNARAQSATS